MKTNLWGDRAFRRTLFSVLIPIVIQNTFNNLVNLLDNIMVGRIGTEAMTGVSVANLLFFVYNLAVFGMMSGAGIYGAQYMGKGDWEGVRKCFRYKLISGFLICSAFIAVLLAWGTPLMQLYMTEDGTFDVAETLRLGRQYMLIIMLQMFPQILVNAYATTLRECGETRMPMIAGVSAVIVNFVFNYLLIFGKLGFPQLGVAGAAIATVFSRFVELAILIIFTHASKARFPFAIGLYKRLGLPWKEAMAITGQGLPLMINETMWSLGNTFLVQFYSTRGLTVVAALNISNTVNNLFLVAAISFGSAVGIIVGQLLGAGKVEKAKEADKQLIFYSVLICTLVAIVMAVTAPYFPLIYNTTPQVQQLATEIMWICAGYLILESFFNTCYFTLRAGGNSLITIIFDSGFLWAVMVPLAFIWAYKTEMAIVPLYLVCQLPAILKIPIGAVLLKKSHWAKSLVADEQGASQC